MSGKSGGILKRLFGGSSEPKSEDAAPGRASRLSMAPMDPGPILTLCFSYERGESARDVTHSDSALERTLQLLARLKIHATFHCPARLAETAFNQLGSIRDAGHEIACQGYRRESAAELTGNALSDTLRKCRESLSELDVTPVGFHPPGELGEAGAYLRLAREGFRYVSALSREDNPRLLVETPPLVRMPIAANDSGYARHPEDPRHVLTKHLALVDRLIRKRHYLALNYHVWVLGDATERFADLEAVASRALRAGASVRPFVTALPAPYRPASGDPAREKSA